MRRYLPFAIIGVVFLIALGTGLALLRWKQPTSAPIAPLVPIVPETPIALATPITPPEPAASAVPIASITPIVPAASAVPMAQVAPTVPAFQEMPGKPRAGAIHSRGGANAPVTIEEFGDFQCPPCGELFPKLTKVEADYGERLRVVFRHHPMRKHEHAVLAARAAEAAGLQGRFWEMHDLLFENSLRWTKGVDTVGPEATPSRRLQSKILAMEIEVRDVFISYAERLKLDVERFKTDMDGEEVKARIEADKAHGGTLGVDRTPTLYINGRLLPVVSYQSVPTLHAAIDAALNGTQQEKAAPGAQPATPGQPK
jgi:protein-disulfide isomerase